MPYNIQTARLANAVRRFFGVKGQLPLQLVDDVFPFVDIGRLADDLAFQGDVDLWHAFALSPTVAGEFSAVDVQNPAGSGKLIVIDSWRASADCDVRLIAGQSLGSLVAGVSPPLSRDGRHINQAFSVEVRTDSDAILGGRYDTGSTFHSHGDAFILSPGTYLHFANVASATAMSVELFGFERPATEEELAP